MKTKKAEIKKQMETVMAYYQEIFAGTETNIIFDEDWLGIEYKDFSKEHNKVFTRICNREKCVFLKYSITLTSFCSQPTLELIIDPKDCSLRVQRFHILLSATPKNIKNFKKFVNEKTFQDEVNSAQYQLKCLERMLKEGREEKAKWQKCLKFLEAEKEKSPKKDTCAFVDDSIWDYIREL